MMYDLGKGFGSGRNQLTHNNVFEDDTGPNGGEFSDQFPNVVQGNKGPFEYGGQRLTQPRRRPPPPQWPLRGMVPQWANQGPHMGMPQSMAGLMGAKGPMRG